MYKKKNGRSGSPFAAGITNYGFVAGAHTIDTDTQLDSVGIANYGYVAGAHTLDTDTQLD